MSSPINPATQHVLGSRPPSARRRVSLTATACTAVASLAGLLVSPAHGGDAVSSQGASASVTRFVQDISGLDPFGGCGFGNPAGAGSETSPVLAVDPKDSRNLIAYYLQNDASGAVASVSHDGGQTWKQVVIPGQTLCNGGSSAEPNTYPISAFDQGVSFGKDGTAYISTGIQDVILCDGSNPSCGSADFPLFDLRWRLQANYSTDRGDTWSDPVDVDVAGVYPHLALDAPAITGDPTRRKTAYLNWDRPMDWIPVGGHSDEMFSKTTDGGATWSTPEVLPLPADPDDFFIGGAIHVLPDGTLVSTYVRHPNNVFPPPATFELIRSEDAGDTWSDPIHIADAAPSLLRDPDTLEILNKANDTPGQPTYAVGPEGELYGTWSQIDSPTGSRILIVKSKNGGRTWTAPRPLEVSSSQAFKPTIAVTESGMVGVMYLDFRNDVPGDQELTTDVWFSSSADGGRSWSETHVYGPFDYRPIPTSGANAVKIGDTFGLVATDRNGFGAAFPATLSDQTSGVTDIFFALIGR